MKAYYKYLEKTTDGLPGIIDATANPYKFSKAVLEALEGEVNEENEF